MDLPVEIWGEVFSHSDALTQYLLRRVCPLFYGAKWRGGRPLTSLFDENDDFAETKQWTCKSPYRPRRLTYNADLYTDDTSLIAQLRFKTEICGVYRVVIDVYVSLHPTEQLFSDRHATDPDDMRFLDDRPIRYTECRGSKCRRTVNLEDDRIWCSSCDGDMGLYVIFSVLINAPKWKDIPRNEILGYRYLIEKLDVSHPDLIARRKFVKERIETLEQDLAPNGYYDQQRAAAQKNLATLLAQVTW